MRVRYLASLAALALVLLTSWWGPQTRVGSLGRVEPYSHRDAAAQQLPMAPGLSSAREQAIANRLAASVPQIAEVYIEPVHGGYDLVATASLSDLSVGPLEAEAITARYLGTVYGQLAKLPVIYAALYAEEAGQYVLAAGLGERALRQLAVRSFAPDGGLAFVQELVRLDRYQGPLGDAAFVQYAGS